MADFNKATIDDIYEAFAFAETGSQSDPWIRTIGTKGQREGTQAGSNAYGPVQILSSYMHEATQQVYKHNNKMMIPFTGEELDFIDRFKKQGAEFYKHGNNKGKIDDYDKRYDYGGSGDMSASDRNLYESAAKKIMAYEWKRGGSIRALKRIWRGNDMDIDYFEKFDRKLTKILDEKNNKKDMASLKPDETIMNTIGNIPQ